MIAALKTTAPSSSCIKPKSTRMRAITGRAVIESATPITMASAR